MSRGSSILERFFFDEFLHFRGLGHTIPPSGERPLVLRGNGEMGKPEPAEGDLVRLLFSMAAKRGSAHAKAAKRFPIWRLALRDPPRVLAFGLGLRLRQAQQVVQDVADVCGFGHLGLLLQCLLGLF